MKQELPIAITLLATGCLLWLGQSKDLREAAAAIQQSETAETTQATELQTTAAPTNNIAPPQQTPLDPNALRISGSQLLTQVADSLRNGSPMLGDIAVTTHLSDKDHVIQGRFWNQGQGSQQSRMELILSSTNPTKLTQICDGRFSYRLTEHHNKRELKFFDVQRLKNSDAGMINATLPATWVGTGSLDSLYTNLAEAFNFADVKLAPGNSNMVEAVGTWKPIPLSKLMANRVDHRDIVPKTKWELLPPQIPHGVRLRFSNVANVGWQPAEILFFKFNEDSGGKPVPAMSIQFAQIRYQSISADLFNLESDESGAIDETWLYNQHIDLMTGKNRVAEDSGDTIR